MIAVIGMCMVMHPARFVIYEMGGDDEQDCRN